MKRCIGVYLLMLISTTVSSTNLTVIDGKLSCPDTAGRLECAIAFERQIVKPKADFVVRESGWLKIRLKSGNYRALPALLYKKVLAVNSPLV